MTSTTGAAEGAAEDPPKPLLLLEDALITFTVFTPDALLLVELEEATANVAPLLLEEEAEDEDGWPNPIVVTPSLALLLLPLPLPIWKANTRRKPLLDMHRIEKLRISQQYLDNLRLQSVNGLLQHISQFGLVRLHLRQLLLRVSARGEAATTGRRR